MKLILSDESPDLAFILSLSIHPISISNMRLPLRKLCEDEFIDKKELMPKPCVHPCTIFSHTETIYNNPILNYPKLFKYCCDKLGQDNAFELGWHLDSDLIYEIAEGNYEMVLAGLLNRL